MRLDPHQRTWRVATRISFATLGVIGICVIIYSTKWGAALLDDSYYYVHAARDLLAGNGFTMNPHFPPLLSLILAIIGIAGADPLSAIRWLNAILFGINIYLFGHIVFHYSKSAIFSLLSAFLFLISSVLIDAHSSAMSEPLFFTLTLLGIISIIAPNQKTLRLRILISGFCFGLATLTRYIGVSFLLAGGISWFLIGGKTWKARLSRALTFVIAGLLPNLLWLARNQALYGRPTSRIFEWHPAPSDWLQQIANTILIWFIPGRFVHNKEKIWLIAIGFGFVCLLIWVFWKFHNQFANHFKSLINSPFASFLIFAILSYLSVLVFSRTFLDRNIPPDNRLLSSIWILVLMLLFYSLARIWNYPNWLSRTLVVIFITMLITVNIIRSFETVHGYHQSGRGYASARHHISETYAYIRERPDIPIFSNSYAAIYFWTGLETQPIPSSFGVETMKQEMKRTGAYLIIFNFISLELYDVTLEELTNGLVEVIRLSEATIHRYP